MPQNIPDIPMAERIERIERIAYSPAEAAVALGCTRAHVHQMIAKGELPSFKLGRRRLIPADVVARLMGETTGDTTAAV